MINNKTIKIVRKQIRIKVNKIIIKIINKKIYKQINRIKII